MRKKSVLLLTAVLALLFKAGTAAASTQENSPETESGIPAEVFTFLEKIIFQIDSVQNVKGNLGEFLSLRNVRFYTDNFSVSNIKELPSMELSLNNGKWYEARWMDQEGNQKIYLEFPASYEVIYGLRKDQIERKIKEEIRRQPVDWASIDINPDDELISTDSMLYKRKKEKILEIPAMTDNIYFSPDSIAGLKPVFDSRWKEQSATNLLQGVIPDLKNYKIYINQDRYNSKEEYTVDLAQWLNFCRSLPATVYCSLEEERDDGLKMLVLIDVYPLGYRHMLSVILQPDFVDNENSVLKGKLYTYIPAYNVSSMYYDLIYKK